MRWTPDWKKVEPNIAESVDVNDSRHRVHLPSPARDEMVGRRAFQRRRHHVLVRGRVLRRRADRQASRRSPGFRRRAGEGGEERRRDGRLQIRSSPTACSCSNSPTASANSRPCIRSIICSSSTSGTTRTAFASCWRRTPSAKDWVALFNSKISPNYLNPYWQNPELPTHQSRGSSPTNTAPSSGSSRCAIRITGRSTPPGTSCPISTASPGTRSTTFSSRLLKAINGEIDYQLRHVGQLPFKSTLYDNQKKGNYRFSTVADHPANDAVLLFNLNVNDPIKRKVFRTRISASASPTRSTARKSSTPCMWARARRRRSRFGPGIRCTTSGCRTNIPSMI